MLIGACNPGDHVVCRTLYFMQEALEIPVVVKQFFRTISKQVRHNSS